MNDTYESKLKISMECKLIYDNLIKKFPKDYGLTYLRGNLNLYLQNYFDAILDFDFVIEKDEDTHAKYYLGRGKTYACLSMFREAINDLSIALNIDKNVHDAYLC